MTMQTIREVLKRIPAILMGAYESPAEECLGERLRSAINPTTSYQTQVWVETLVSRFRLDILLIDKTGRRIVVEVDGKEFHEPVLDYWRTVFIIGDGQADVVYRVPASYLKRNLIGVLAGLATLEPLCFSEQEVARWKEATALSSPYQIDDEAESDWDDEEEDEEDSDGKRLNNGRWIESSMAIESHFMSDARDCTRTTIKTRYEFAAATGLKDLHAIQEAWTLAHPA